MEKSLDAEILACGLQFKHFFQPQLCITNNMKRLIISTITALLLNAAFAGTINSDSAQTSCGQQLQDLPCIQTEKVAHDTLVTKDIADVDTSKLLIGSAVQKQDVHTTKQKTARRQSRTKRDDPFSLGELFGGCDGCLGTVMVILAVLGACEVWL